MAQQANPKVAGQTLLRRAHLTRSSIFPVFESHVQAA
jgi:hypothetical protein